MDYYELIRQDRVSECHQIANDEYIKTKSYKALASRAAAGLILKKYEEAVYDYLEIIKINKGDSESDYKSAGVAYWLQGKSEEAIKIWEVGMNAPYTDAAGGAEIPLLLYYAAVSLKDEDLEKKYISLLKRKWKTKRTQGNFPGSIAGYLIGAMNEQQLINTLSLQPILRARQMCKAQFYIALMHLKNKERDKFYYHLEQCVSNKTYIEKEYYLAIGEIDKMI